MFIRMLFTKSCLQSVMMESRVTVWIMLLMLRVSVAQVTITTQPSNVTVCSGEDAVFTCVLAGPSITRGDITTAGWHVKGSSFFLSVSGKDRHSVISTIIDDMLSDTLTVTNVLQDDDGNLYRCVVTSEVTSDIVSITVTGGIPDMITDLTIPPDMITSTSFVAQWSEPSSDPMCGTVQYIVTVYTGGIVIRNNTIERTTYTATGLCSDTLYKVDVSADNIAGNSIPTTIGVITTPAGSPITTPSMVLKVHPLTSTSFTVSWTSSVPNNHYTVIWTNLHTGVMYSRTVSGNANSYTVTRLSGDVNYNVSVAAVNMCGMMTSDPVTVYDTPSKPQFVYCMSYKEQPEVRILSQVIVDFPRMSLMLQFTASYQTGSPTVMDATCSDIQDNMQYNCTAEFTVDIIPSVALIQSVNVTVSGPYGSSSSLMEVEQRLGPVLGVTQGEVLDNSAELVCTLTCFTPNIHCKLSNIAIDGVKCKLTPNYTASSILGSLSSYDYPIQNIMIHDLTSGTRYNYCVTGVNISDGEMVDIGEPICGSFRTTAVKRSENNESSSTVMVATISCSLTFILTLTITAIITFSVTYKCMKQKLVVTSNQTQPTQKVFYEQIEPPHIISPQNAQNPLYDTTSRQAAKDLKKSSGEIGYELIMTSVKIPSDSDDATLPYRERAHGIKYDNYVQIKRPVYQNVTPATKNERKEEHPTCKHQLEIK